MHHSQACDALANEIEHFARLLDGAPIERTVVSCPQWCVGDLVEHLGTVHRWATMLVAAVSPVRIPFTEVSLGEPPYDGAWLTSGGVTLLEALRAGDPDAAMYAWGADQHLRFWSRRQLHETMMHRCDLALTLDLTPRVEPEVATDAVDEFLVNLDAAKRFSPRVGELLGAGEVLRFETTDTQVAWDVRLEATGFALGPVHERPTATLRGTSEELLLVLYRRRTRDASELTTSGDADLIDFWLDRCALE